MTQVRSRYDAFMSQANLIVRTLWITRKGYSHDLPPELIEGWDEFCIDGNEQGAQEAFAAALDAIGSDLDQFRFIDIAVPLHVVRGAFDDVPATELPSAAGGTTEIRSLWITRKSEPTALPELIVCVDSMMLDENFEGWTELCARELAEVGDDLAAARYIDILAPAASIARAFSPPVVTAQAFVDRSVD